LPEDQITSVLLSQELTEEQISAARGEELVVEPGSSTSSISGKTKETKKTPKGRESKKTPPTGCASPWGLQIELNLDQAKLLILDSVFIDLIHNTVLCC